MTVFRRLEAQRPALKVDLASSEVQRMDAAREWALYHLLVTLLQHSLSEAEDLRCHLSIHLGFQDDYLALRYQDETSPLPDLSQDNEVAATLQFWLYLLQLSPIIQSEHEWVFRVPTSSTTVPFRRMALVSLPPAASALLFPSLKFGNYFPLLFLVWPE